MRLPVNFLRAEPITDGTETRELRSSYDTEGDWVSADRKTITPAPFGVNIDNALLLDFDANGYLGAAEIIGRRAFFEPLNIGLSSSPPVAMVRLAHIPKSSGVEEFDCPVTVYASPDGPLVQAVVPDLMLGAVWFSLGRSLLFALNEGRVASVLFDTDPGSSVEPMNKKKDANR
jgi:hypothetical protein